MPAERDPELEADPKPRRHGHRRRNLKHRFEIVKTLGQGTYGKVKLAVEKATGDSYAIKSIRKSQIGSEQDLARIRREIQVMASLSHPHIISIYEVFENSEKIVIVMEYASGGELYDHCNDKQGLYDDEARTFFRQIVSAVLYLHMNGIVHRDLKLENIVLDANGNAKIADFGFANIYSTDKHLSTFCGSPLYASPEIVNGLPYCGPEVDCWSLGVLLYAVIYGAMPFDGSDFRRLRNQITAGDYFKPHRRSDALDLISRMLCPNPAKRATIEDIAAAVWLNDGYNCSPALDTAPGKPIDHEELLRRLSEGSSEESDCDSLRRPEASVPLSTPPLKSILKKPKCDDDSPSEPAAGCQRSRSLDLAQSVPLRNPSVRDTPPRPRSSHITTYPAFDSSRKPKKGILKNCKPQQDTSPPSSLLHQDPLVTGDISPSSPPHEDSPAPGVMPPSSSPHQSTPAPAVVSPTSPPHQDLPAPSVLPPPSSYDLTDIEAVLDSLMAETATLCDMEKRLEEQTASPAQTSADSGIGEDMMSPETPVLRPDADISLEPGDLLLTSTPAGGLTTGGLTAGGRRRRGRSKAGSTSDPSWRYSTGSQGSTSSTDLLDFSYDSVEGEGLLSEYFSMPLTNAETGERVAEEDRADAVFYADRDPDLISDRDPDEGLPPPLPKRPPPDLPAAECPFAVPFTDRDIVEKILWLGERGSPPGQTGGGGGGVAWDEVEDIYRKALELQKEWS